ncbi:MAG: hypothetical protein HY795_06885 [Desulfovibrio sp.]|nr:hypothetical protein [Desulfovibrio sp.]MBI4959406.1 hypothetical protein [Desulfovibrio sp.]
MDDERQKRFYHAFISLSMAYGTGLVRLMNARIFQHKTILHYLKTEPKSDENSEGRLCIEGFHGFLGRVLDDELSSNEYISLASSIVYLVSVFESYVDSITKLLILYHPGVVRDSLSADWNAIENAKSISALKRSVVDVKCKKLSYMTMKDRLKFLKKSFGLKINISDVDYQSFLNVFELRNALVHDQCFLDIVIDDEGKVCVSKDKCELSPVPIPEGYFWKAFNIFDDVSLCLVDSFINDIIKYSEKDSYDRVHGIIGICRELRKEPKDNQI